MTRLSILIPCLGNAPQFEGTLASVLQNRPDHCEVLVAHAQSYDDPYDLADEVHFVEVAGATSIVELINAGMDEADGDVLHLLAPCIEVREGWEEAALRHFSDPQVAAVAPIVIRKQQPTHLVTLGVGYRIGGGRLEIGQAEPLTARHALKSEIVGPSLIAGFYNMDVMDALGGFNLEVGDELADVDTALAIIDLNLRSIAEGDSVVEQVSDDNLMTTCSNFTSGQHAERLFFRHGSQHGGLAALLAHPVEILRDVACDVPHPRLVAKLFGRLITAWEFGIVRGYERQLTAAREWLNDLEQGMSTIPFPARSTTKPAATNANSEPQRKAA